MGGCRCEMEAERLTVICMTLPSHQSRCSVLPDIEDEEWQAKDYLMHTSLVPGLSTPCGLGMRLMACQLNFISAKFSHAQV